MNDEFDDVSVDCPHCGAAMYEDAPQCPACGEYILQSDFNRKLPTWLVIVVVITIASFLFSYVAGVWF